jgi:hypothetical protein
MEYEELIELTDGLIKSKVAMLVKSDAKGKLPFKSNTLSIITSI